MRLRRLAYSFQTISVGEGNRTSDSGDKGSTSIVALSSNGTIVELCNAFTSFLDCKGTGGNNCLTGSDTDGDGIVAIDVRCGTVARDEEGSTGGGGHIGLLGARSINDVEGAGGKDCNNSDEVATPDAGIDVAGVLLLGWLVVVRNMPIICRLPTNKIVSSCLNTDNNTHNTVRLIACGVSGKHTFKLRFQLRNIGQRGSRNLCTTMRFHIANLPLHTTKR